MEVGARKVSYNRCTPSASQSFVMACCSRNFRLGVLGVSLWPAEIVTGMYEWYIGKSRRHAQTTGDNIPEKGLADQEDAFLSIQ